MQKVLGDFIHALRQAGLPISSAETLDGLRAAQLVGIDNAPLLKQSLGMTLAKCLENRLIFDQIFDQYFNSHSQFNTGDRATSETDANQAATARLSEPFSEAVNSLESPLAQQLINGDMAGMQVMIASAAGASGAQEVTFMTQVPMVSYRVMQALGDGALQQELAAMAEREESSAILSILQQRRARLQQQVRDYLEQQYLVLNQNEPNKRREGNLQKISLTSIDQRNYKLMGELVRQAAKRLASMHSRRRRITRRGLLDVRRTITANAAYDGFLFHTKWKSTRIERPKVMVLCDVSGSVSKVARFLLLFLYSLQDVLPNVRSFVFSSYMAEVTKLFEEQDMEQGLAEVLHNWGNKPTNYGKALSDFETMALADIDNRTTVIMLGDARNNNEDGNIALWEEIYRRSQRVLWLNPEGQVNWDSGDSIMSKYAAYCSHVETCNSLRDLNRILGSVLKHEA